jgi:hypothetical protein
VRNPQHSPFDFLHLRQANLVNFFRRQVRGGALFYAESVTLRAIGQ